MLLCICFTGCNKKEKFTDYSFDSFDTVTTIIGFEQSEKIFKENAEKIKNWLYEYHKLYNIYSTYEIANISNINRSTNIPVKVDKRIIDLLDFSKQMYTLTSGEINIAMGSVLSEWHYYRENGLDYPEKASLPNYDVLLKKAKHTNIENIIIDFENSTVLLNDTELRVDVGAIAKGYAVEKTAEKMLAENITGYILNVGGNIKTVGLRLDGKKWNVGIENPDKESTEAYIEELSLDNNLSLVTSGSYQRFYTVDGKEYHHIIDGDTLFPADYFVSVSVLCNDSGIADALSTALFCMPFEDGLKLIDSLDNVEAMWVFKDATKKYSENFKEFCK